MRTSILGQSGKGIPRVPPGTASGELFYQEVEVDSGAAFPQELILNLIGENGVVLQGADQAGVRTNVTVNLDACDHIVVTEADLPPLLGSSHILTSGSWCFVADLDLGNNNIVVPAGVSVELMGLNTDLTSAIVGPVIDVSTDTSHADIENLNILTNGGPGGSAIRSRCAAGDFNRITNSRVFGDIGILHESNGLIVEHCNGSNADQIIRQDGANTRLIVKASRWLGANYAIFVADGFSTQVWSSWFEFLAFGIGLPGAPDHCLVMGTEFANLGTAIDIPSAGMQDLKIRGNDFTLQGVGIAMPAANVPTGGASIVGNAFSLIGFNFTGFTHLTARVNSKANLGPGGLLSETPIVP